ncbi:MAG: hypothetical protein WBP41_08090 [Saprospiraceae bacterium]
MTMKIGDIIFCDEKINLTLNDELSISFQTEKSPVTNFFPKEIFSRRLIFAHGARQFTNL